MKEINNPLNQPLKSKILIVEDDVIIGADLAADLQSLGYKISGNFTSAEKALDTIKEERPDLVMMDIVLKGKMDGIEAAEIIREKWDLPVVFLTAYADTDRLERAKLAYPFGYLLKPFNERDVKVTVEMALYVGEVEAKRRKAEQELFQEKEKLRTILDNIPVMIAFFDKFANFQYINSYWKERLGWSLEEAKNMDLFSELYPDAEYRKYVLDFISKAEGLFGDFKTRIRNGSLIDTSWANVLLSDGSYIGIGLDISERMRAEDALRMNEERLRIISDNTYDWEYWRGPDGKFIWVSPACETISGYPPEWFMQNLSNTVGSLVHPSDRDIWNGHTKEVDAQNQEHKRLDVRIIKPSGEVVWISHTCKPIYNSAGVFLGRRGCNRDITERKRAEEKNLLLAAIVESSNDAIIGKTLDGIITSWNKGAANIYGYQDTEILGKPVSILVPPARYNEVLRLLERIKNGENIEHYETVRRKKDGSDINVSLTISPIRNADGKILGVSTVARDITEQKILQSQLQQAQKMESIGTLTGGIAHDFNNLLQVINGYAQILLMEKRETDREYSSLKTIHNAGNRAADLVRQLLLFSRKVETRKKIVRLNQEIENARRMLERIIPKMIELELHPGRGLWDVKVDPVQIDQIILNLGKNAADAMPDGGKLLIETENIVLNEEFARNHLGAKPGRYVVLTVSDTGHGMDQETVEHMFDPFFTTKEIGKGTGLGLASVYGIVKSHDGSITCYSEIGRGTSFKIYLPAIESKETDRSSTGIIKQIQGGTETILLVDDEEPIRDFAKQVLLKFGYKVLTASSGEEALGIYLRKQNEIDLVIMDIGMPGMGGHKCLTEILKLDPSAKVLIGSGYSNEQVKKTLEAGAAGFVGKPYQFSELLNKVRTVLGREE
ncbi:MAG: PAS domain S-box protein [Deltaproteobacteria bacterium]|nr:PAS domain S-box protein [Deltaproteobacteria bacterium]